MYRCLLVTIASLFFVASGFAGDQDSAKKQEANQMPPFVALLLKGGTDNFIKHFDKNKDGVLSNDEAPPGLARIFDRFDTNHDGKLDKEEIERLFQVMRQRFGDNKKPEQNPNKNPNKNPANNNLQVDRMVEKLLEQMDANKDGKISKAEAKGRIAEFFDQLDTNKDGYLDKEELRRAAARFVANQGGKGGPGGPAPGLPKRGPEFDDFDKNADGRLTREELQGTPFADHFDEIDTNKDGKIDRKEFEAYLKKQAAQNADKSSDEAKSAKKAEKQ